MGAFGTGEGIATEIPDPFARVKRLKFYPALWNRPLFGEAWFAAYTV